MTTVPVLSVFGSCRVYDPAKLLDTSGTAKLNQQNIFGFVHNSREVLQQIGMLTGAIEIPGRLRPFLNVPEKWAWQPRSTHTTLDYKFARTDCFIVEISSVRLLRFKAMYLQLNRTHELLSPRPDIEQNWWIPLTQTGRNDRAAYPATGVPPLHREIVEQLSCTEASEIELVRDIIAINEMLPRPVLFVSHFNTTADGNPVRQRGLIVEAMRAAAEKAQIAYWNPTALMLAEGPRQAMLDSTHYRPEFLGQVADALLAEVSGLLARTPAQRRLPDRYEFTLD